jgi:hypothetical protein
MAIDYIHVALNSADLHGADGLPHFCGGILGCSVGDRVLP